MTTNEGVQYPCMWEYTIIGTNEAAVREAAAFALGDRAYNLNASKTSKKGNYLSFKLNTVLEDDATRIGIFEALKRGEGIKYVL